MKKGSLAVVFAVLVILGAAQAQNISIGTGAPGSIYYNLGTALAKLANEKAGISATLQPYGSPNVFIPALNSGELQFGFGNVYELTLAYEGKEYFAGRPNRDMRAVGIAFPLRTGLYVRKNSSIQKIADLKGHPVPAGYTGQKVLLPLLDAVYATGGLTAADMKPVNVPTALVSAEAFAAGKVDMFLFAMGAGKVREVDASVSGGLRALPIDNTPANLAAIRKHFPIAYLRLEKPGQDNPGVLEPLYCIAYDGLLFTSAKVSDDLVYKMTKVLYENKADVVASSALLSLFEPKDMAKKIPVPYHPGAIKFYKEHGMWPPK